MKIIRSALWNKMIRSLVQFQKYKFGTTLLSPDQESQHRKPQGSFSAPFDIFKAMKTDPLKEYKNAKLLRLFQLENGNIMPRYMTGLTKINQTKLAKAIKRSRHFGLLTYLAPGKAEAPFPEFKAKDSLSSSSQLQKISKRLK
eukprot:NODE_314_length_9990_cov_0.963401.p6 type:complete len:143 gc:universal NODE_314_length_9990_cov_0.963401:6656-7084(+)